jgi:hypothetical protein
LRTDELIRALASDGHPVQRLPHPMQRAVTWLLMSAVYVAAVVLAYRALGENVRMAGGASYLTEQLATIATALTAAVAAFCCVVPGRSRLIALAPLLPLAAWLLSMGDACAGIARVFVGGGIGAEGGWECLPPSVIVGFGPALVMVAMLRRGAPLYPRATMLLGALAAAALGNLGLRLFHEGDVTPVMLAWQLAAAVVLASLAGLLAPRILAWPRARLRPASRA